MSSSSSRGIHVHHANVGGDAGDSDADVPTRPRPAPTRWSAARPTTRSTRACYRPASIGDFVWDDLNGNGQQDSGEPGIGGVTVKLLDAGGATIATTTTNASGLYAFSDLAPGSYTVQFVTPGGYVATAANVGGDSSDSDASTVDGKTASYTLAGNESNTTVGRRFYRPAAIGDRVWDDLNGNGQQDGGEPGIANVTVKLFTAGGSLVGTTSTNASGLYSFTGLVPGSYNVEFVKPAGYAFHDCERRQRLQRQ
jgi:hypothetical protein